MVEQDVTQGLEQDIQDMHAVLQRLYPNQPHACGIVAEPEPEDDNVQYCCWLVNAHQLPEDAHDTAFVRQAYLQGVVQECKRQLLAFVGQQD